MGKTRKQEKISWNDADQECRKMNAYLPYFTSRADLDKFITLIKFSFKLPIIEAIFIGLVYNETKVFELNAFKKYII